MPLNRNIISLLVFWKKKRWQWKTNRKSWQRKSDSSRRNWRPCRLTLLNLSVALCLLFCVFLNLKIWVFPSQKTSIIKSAADVKKLPLNVSMKPTENTFQVHVNKKIRFCICQIKQLLVMIHSPYVTYAWSTSNPGNEILRQTHTTPFTTTSSPP